MKTIRKIIVVILIIFVAIGGYVAGTWIITKRPPALITKLVPTQSRNIVIMGMDGEGLRSDVLMVAFLNGESGKINLLSVPRDTRVRINDKYYKINSAYALGKEEQTIETLENLLDIKIDNYIKFSFETFRNVIDALGGVDFDVPQDMFYEDPYQDLYIDLKAGEQHLDGAKAEQLVRFRQYPMGDEARIAVQQDFIHALVKQKLNPKTLIKLPKIMGELKKNIDTDIAESDYISLALSALKAENGAFETYKLPGQAQRISGLSYYIADMAETEKLIDEISH